MRWWVLDAGEEGVGMQSVHCRGMCFDVGDGGARGCFCRKTSWQGAEALGQGEVGLCVEQVDEGAGDGWIKAVGGAKEDALPRGRDGHGCAVRAL